MQWNLELLKDQSDDTHRVKPRWVPGDFLSWFVPTKMFTPVLTCRVSVRNCKFNIEDAVQCFWKSHHSAVNLAVGQECKATSVKVTKFAQFNFIGPLPLTKWKAYEIHKDLPIQRTKTLNVDNSQYANSCLHRTLNGNTTQQPFGMTLAAPKCERNKTSWKAWPTASPQILHTAGCCFHALHQHVHRAPQRVCKRLHGRSSWLRWDEI